jgi:hypothetical protein
MEQGIKDYSETKHIRAETEQLLASANRRE